MTMKMVLLCRHANCFCLIPKEVRHVFIEMGDSRMIVCIYKVEGIIDDENGAIFYAM
jgi:hypothetical protein